jgi:DnaK suppressor protein
MKVEVGGKIIEISDNYDPREDKGAYMNDKQRAYFKIKLQNWLKDIEHKLATENIDDVNADYRSTDESDQMAMEANTITELRSKDRLRKLAKKIEEFIGKIDADTYGFCEETGDEIGVNRLMMRPIARFCVEVQEKKDRNEEEREFLDRNQEEQKNKKIQNDDY